MPAMNKPILMRFPLIGEWNTPNTPGSRIPSHGTNALGTRYAYDFLQLNWKKEDIPAIAPMSFRICYSVSHYLRAIAMDCLCMPHVMEGWYM